MASLGMLAYSTARQQGGERKKVKMQEREREKRKKLVNSIWYQWLNFKTKFLKLDLSNLAFEETDKYIFMHYLCPIIVATFTYKFNALNLTTYVTDAVLNLIASVEKSIG